MAMNPAGDNRRRVLVVHVLSQQVGTLFGNRINRCDVCSDQFTFKANAGQQTVKTSKVIDHS